MRLPLKKVVNSSTQKNDIVLQLNTDDCGEKQVNYYLSSDDMLCEVRFFIPPGENKQKVEKKKKEGEQIDEDDDEEDSQPTYQQTLQAEILNKAKIGQTSADSILTIPDVPLVVPRGKYTMDFFRKDIRFHGNTYQFTYDYKGIIRFFLLPMPDEINVSFVIGLENPFKQGQTAYNYIVMQFKRDFEQDIKLKYNRQKLEEIGWKEIKEEYKGPLFNTVSEVLSTITGTKVTVPTSFKSKNGLNCIRCSVGPHSGHLFPLEKSLIYISKPVFFAKHEDIKEIVLQRIGQNNQNKFFDIRINYKNSHQLFSAIEKDELDNITQYFQQKKITIKKNLEEAHQQLQESDDDEVDDDDSRQQDRNRRVQDNLDSEEDDDDFQVGDGQDDDSDDEEGSDEVSGQQKRK
ncbi:hypothetical protein pb186bvf_011959 [Paramecium bursaria]